MTISNPLRNIPYYSCVGKIDDVRYIRTGDRGTACPCYCLYRVTLQIKSRALVLRPPEAVGSGDGIGALLAEVEILHGDLMRLLEGGPGDFSAARIHRCASKYARAVSRYRKAIVALFPAMRDTQPRIEETLRLKCHDTRWQTR